MAIPYYLADLFTDSDTDTDTEGVYLNENGVGFKAMHKPTWSPDEILYEEPIDYLKCEKCGVKFLNVEDGHPLGGNSENDPGRHFYCGKCRVDSKGEEELKEYMVESSEDVVCRECSQKFHIPEALELHCKQVHKPKPITTHQCPGCDALFNAISGITQHIESGQCTGNLSPSGFRKLINYENTPLAKKDLPADILAGSTTTHTWRAGILPGRVKAALAGTSNGFKPEELVPKDFVSVLDYTLPSEPTNSPTENLADCWNKILGAYLCPRLRCGKKFATVTALRAHLESITHDKKAFRCPTCVECFVSSSALLQHAESGACGIKRSPAYNQLIKGATGGLVSVAEKSGLKTGWQKPAAK